MEEMNENMYSHSFLPASASTRTLQSYYLYAYRLGIKTLYYTRLRKTNVQDCLSCLV